MSAEPAICPAACARCAQLELRLSALERQREKLSLEAVRLERYRELGGRLQRLARSLFHAATGGARGQRSEMLEVLAQMDQAGALPQAKAGLAKQLQEPEQDWHEACDAAWQKVALGPGEARAARLVGGRQIEDESVRVFEVRGRFFAQTPAPGDAR